jgi:sugar lactone lactonase YvrE
MTGDPQVLMSGLAFGEQPRWHEGRLWFSDWGTQEVIAVDLDGNREVILRGRSFPLCVDWLPDGRLLFVSSREGLLLRREPDGSLVTHGDLNEVSDPPAGNELVVDGRGNAYVNGGPPCKTASPTASASMPRRRSGTGTFRTSVASAFARAARCWRRSSPIAAASPAR